MGRQKPHSLPCFSPFCLSGSPPRCPVKGERLGARSGFKSHFHPLLTANLRSFLLSLSLFFWKMRLRSTLAPRVVGATGEGGEGIRLGSLAFPPTQPSPLVTLQHGRDGV